MHAHFKNLKIVSSFKVNASEFVQSTTLQLLAELDDWMMFFILISKTLMIVSPIENYKTLSPDMESEAKLWTG